MTRADRRRFWRLYWNSRHAAHPYLVPLERPSWPERTWIRLFG